MIAPENVVSARLTAFYMWMCMCGRDGGGQPQVLIITYDHVWLESGVGNSFLVLWRNIIALQGFGLSSCIVKLFTIFPQLYSQRTYYRSKPGYRLKMIPKSIDSLESQCGSTVQKKSLLACLDVTHKGVTFRKLVWQMPGPLQSLLRVVNS